MIAGAVNALSDRLLRVFVPRASAKAEPCGQLITYPCFCLKPFGYWRNCCSISGTCYPCTFQTWPPCLF